MLDFSRLKEQFMLREYYGVQTPPSQEDFLLYAKLLLSCANGDGELTDAERDWVLWFSATNGVPPAGIEELRTYRASDDVSDLVTQSHVVERAKHAVIYDAIRACDADGELTEGERSTVRKAAQQLGIPDDAVSRIERAWAAEKQARQHRIRVMWRGVLG